MRKVIVSTYATLDGEVDDLREWTVPYDDAGPQTIARWFWK
jgi:hypothetical protein